MAGRKSDFTLTKLDDLFTTQAQRDEEQLSKIRDIPLELIDDFPDHPFKVRDDEDMMQLVESVKERGVITPATVRQKEDGRYELVSGHRRKRACELAGFETLRSEIIFRERRKPMADIKTRDTSKGTIKTINKAAVATERMKKAYVMTKDKAEHSTNASENSAEEYASDKIEAATDRTVHETAYRVDKVGRWGVRETKQNYQKTKTGIEFQDQACREAASKTIGQSCRKTEHPNSGAYGENN